VIPAVVAGGRPTRFSRHARGSPTGLGATAGAVGMYLSFQLEIPSGTTIVLVNAVVFAVVLAVTGGRALRRTAGMDEHTDVPGHPRVRVPLEELHHRRHAPPAPGDPPRTSRCPTPTATRSRSRPARPQGRALRLPGGLDARAARRRPATSATTSARCRPRATPSSGCRRTAAKLARFRDAEALTFPLLSDPDKQVLTAYGAYGESSCTARRSSASSVLDLVLDEQAIGHALRRTPVKAKGHVASCAATSGLTRLVTARLAELADCSRFGPAPRGSVCRVHRRARRGRAPPQLRAAPWCTIRRGAVPSRGAAVGALRSGVAGAPARTRSLGV
jgi:hypothetical protein